MRVRSLRSDSWVFLQRQICGLLTTYPYYITLLPRYYLSVPVAHYAYSSGSGGRILVTTYSTDRATGTATLRLLYSIVIVKQIEVEFLLELSVWGPLNSRIKWVLENVCLSVASSSALTTKRMLSKLTPNMSFGSKYGRKKLF